MIGSSGSHLPNLQLLWHELFFNMTSMDDREINTSNATSARWLRNLEHNGSASKMKNNQTSKLNAATERLQPELNLDSCNQILVPRRVQKFNSPSSTAYKAMKFGSRLKPCKFDKSPLLNAHGWPQEKWINFCKWILRSEIDLQNVIFIALLTMVAANSQWEGLC